MTRYDDMMNADMNPKPKKLRLVDEDGMHVQWVAWDILEEIAAKDSALREALHCVDDPDVYYVIEKALATGDT